ncbi:hypothetical protein [Chryseolinea lacunae]|uniref:Uncharacterized protein n=1 Tax=Chryseolinea lacunae TaxID=2801331 RepID=A0ABS1KMR3_9BACT|nr:hypothetical protein [Chryseolinea lacunae]MBL0740755.1 hypothetical protein [Chryseolinea lacunae]
MNSFFNLTRRNLIKGTILCSIIFFVVMFSLILVLAITKNAWHEFLGADALIMLPIFSIGLSVILMAIAFYTEYVEYANKQKVFQRQPFSQLASVGFVGIKLLDNSLWKLHKEAYLATIDNYQIIADHNGTTSVSFTVLLNSAINMRMPAPEQYRALEISSKSAGLVLKVPVNSSSTPGVEALHGILQNLVKAMIQHGHHPAPNLKGYERMLKVELFTKGVSGGMS